MDYEHSEDELYQVMVQGWDAAGKHTHLRNPYAAVKGKESLFEAFARGARQWGKCNRRDVTWT